MHIIKLSCIGYVFLFPFLDPSIRDLRPEQTFRLCYIVVKSNDYVILKVSI
jgi:hypothetical protein